MLQKTVGRFSNGFWASFRAAAFLRRQPRLLVYIIVPFLVNLVVFSLLIYLGFDFLEGLARRYIPSGEAWYWLAVEYLLRLLLLLLTAVLVFFSFTALGNLIAAPFNDILCARARAILTGEQHGNAAGLVGAAREAWRAVVDESRKVAIFVGGMVLLLFINLIPGIGMLLYPPLSILWTIFFLVVEYTGYVFAVRNLHFTEQRRFIADHKMLMLGFGSGLLLLLAIPILQFFCIPLGVVAATMLCHENDDPSLALDQ